MWWGLKFVSDLHEQHVGDVEIAEELQALQQWALAKVAAGCVQWAPFTA